MIAAILNSPEVIDLLGTVSPVVRESVELSLIAFTRSCIAEGQDAPAVIWLTTRQVRPCGRR